MPAAPKVAYVVYDDGYRAIVSVKLIKDFKPASVADCQKHKEIYWKTNEAGHVDEGYYRGDVVLLGEFHPEEWSVVLNARQRSPRQQSKETEGTQSSKAAPAAETPARKTESPPSVSSKLDSTAVARPRLKRLPRLPVDDFKIVFRPSAGVDLAQYNDVELRAAVVAKSGLHSVAADEDLVCTNLAKNIFTVSTSCVDRVANNAKIRELTLRGKKLGFHAHIAPPDGARAGIIYRAWNVLIHFMAEELPPSVKMFGILYAVFNFRLKVEACLNCRQVGHRRDVCPLPNRLTCSSCGQKHPEDYPCTPQCVICGDAHKTGDRACKQRFQRGFSRLSRPRQRPQQEHQQEQPEFQLEKESFPSIDDRNRSSRSKSPGRNRSGISRSPGRNRGSKGKSPGRSASQSRDFSTKPEKGLGASDELPLFSQVDNQIHLGNGILLEQEKWAWLLLRPRDSSFCKEATKLLWGVSALHNRSITGAPCRRYVRSEKQAPPRRALTPKKLEAVGNAFSKYIAGRPSEVAPIERLRKMNRFIAEMLNDLNK
ncbi:hypothetical protein HPB51_020658 [Rhipicephalus microplus]|uniref:Uncharacterized protein n=1 Tax=Rhipicephalus microplus TaxID=6941 RepID=A0A9J6D747_RHIMP|nr:hypothetical protein HPB51_020658 [Rhipicephalus microplus]